MVSGSGAVAAQSHAAKAGVDGVVLLGGFLQRRWRPSFAACQEKWRVQPANKCASGKSCPGGYLPEHVHDCDGPQVPAPDYKIPSLTIGGGLDGVVRIARVAEAWYTQQNSKHQVVVVEGMNHGDVMGTTPVPVAAMDLESELGPVMAVQQVASLFATFLSNPGTAEFPSPAAIFQPFQQMFVEQEGSWWWTSNYEEKGSSVWASNSNRRMCEPMPDGFDNWRHSNEFHLLSDEDMIPPYYRDKHRANIALENGELQSRTITQLRYVELSVTDVAAGLNGYAIIKEEKAGVLESNTDDGNDYTSAKEIATKLNSREKAFNVTIGITADESLDDGDRCEAINHAAYQLALETASPSALKRFQASGRPLKMVSDKKPTPPAGPWWIWNYLQFTDKGDNVEVMSYYAYYALSGLAYGAGNHYCKLLSPARALEWIYTDGLRPVAAHSCCIKKTILGTFGCGLIHPKEVHIADQAYCCPTTPCGQMEEKSVVVV
jgi:hypothetical protein